MSEDKRELILARLLEILNGVSDFNRVDRNVDELPEMVRPCAVLIDGDEQRSTDAQGRDGQPIIMIMSPVIAIGVSSPSADDLGAAASVLRGAVIKAVLNDATLRSIAGTNRRIFYDGLTGKLSHGSLMAADAELRFAISYPLKPADL